MNPVTPDGDTAVTAVASQWDVLRFILPVWSLRVLLVSVWLPFGCSSFLPQFTDDFTSAESESPLSLYVSPVVTW